MNNCSIIDLPLLTNGYQLNNSCNKVVPSSNSTNYSVSNLFTGVSKTNKTHQEKNN